MSQAPSTLKFNNVNVKGAWTDSVVYFKSEFKVLSS